MISTVDQIAADTGAKSLTGVLMSQDHKGFERFEEVPV